MRRARSALARLRDRLWQRALDLAETPPTRRAVQRIGARLALLRRRQAERRRGGQPR